MNNDRKLQADIEYNNKLKEKITSQAKRLTKLELEKEELIELLKEKNISSDNSLTSSVLSTNKKYHSQTASKSKLKATIPQKTNISSSYTNTKRNIITTSSSIKSNNFIEDKYNQQLLIASVKIAELKKRNNEMLSYKDNISQRLTQTTIDIEKTKKSLHELQNERDELNDKVIELSNTIKENEALLKQRDESISSFESIVQALKKEKSELMSQIKKSEGLKALYDLNQNELIALKNNNDKYQKDIQMINNKNKKLYQDNKDLASHLNTFKNDNEKIKIKNEDLQKTNQSFTQTIEVITKQLSEFQNKVEKDINDTLKQSMTNELEMKKREFMKMISAKEKEIEKLKELTQNYNLLETELTNSLKQKDDMYIKLKDKYDILTDKFKKYKLEHVNPNDEVQKVLNENKAFQNEIEEQRVSYEKLSDQSEKVSIFKMNQINQLKLTIKTLEDRVIVLEKNKNYYEYLIKKTHPNSESIKEVIELYSEIVGLEQQRRLLEKEIVEMRNGEYYNKTISNIDKKISHLKESLKYMENDLVTK